MIPARYTYDGENISPCINWQGTPKNTNSLIIIMEDRDIPMPQIRLFTCVHWIVYNISPDISTLPRAIPECETIEGGALQGMTSYRIFGYSGPHPVFGIHRYCFNILAIDIMVDLKPKDATRKNILKNIEGHLLAKGTLVGRYGRLKIKQEEITNSKM